MTVVMTPVGTSLFTNGSENNRKINQRFPTIKDKPEADWGTNTGYIDKLRSESERFIKECGISASAELQSTAVIRDKLEDNIIVHLLASDTIASRLAAEILRDQINSSSSVLGDKVTAKFNADPAEVGIDVIRNLQVENSVNFSRGGMPNLFHRINYIKDWEAGGIQNLAINITGGYGATLPYLTIFAQLEGVPLYYNFEGQEELITIPRVPLVIDSDLIESHAGVLAQIADHMDDPERWRTFKSKNEHAVKELDAFIWEDDSLGAELSPMGNIFWNNYLKSHFLVELPPSGNRGTIDESIIDQAIRELYRKLNGALSPSYLAPTCCYGRLRELGHDHDLNHTGQVNGQDIFIFKSTDQAQVRLMYTFVVNGQTITRITIFDSRGHRSTEEYTAWKQKFATPPKINFETYTFDVL